LGGRDTVKDQSQKRNSQNSGIGRRRLKKGGGDEELKAFMIFKWGGYISAHHIGLFPRRSS